MPHIYECGVETRHYFFDPAEIYVTNVKLIAGLLLMEFDQFFILKQSHLYTLRCGIYNQLFVQDERNLISEKGDEWVETDNGNKTQKRKEFSLRFCVVYGHVPHSETPGIISSYACSFSTSFCVCGSLSYVFFFFYRKA